MAKQPITLADFAPLARKYLPRFLFDMIEGGIGDEDCVARNRQAFRSSLLTPRSCTNVAAINQSTTLFGRVFDSGFGIAPMGAGDLFRPGADFLIAKAAAKANVPYVMSGASMALLEEVARATPGHIWFQLYPARDRAISVDFMERARNEGVTTLFVTVDTPVQPKRERSLRSGVTLPLKPKPALLLKLLGEALLHPSWTLGYLRGGGMPSMRNWARYAASGAHASEIGAFYRSQSPSIQTWRDLEHIRSRWHGELVVKGILHPDDALLAANIGANGVVVSNHGGKVLDQFPASLHALPPIVDAVAGRMTVLMDSGVRQGMDVIIARAAGASGVLLGRPALYAATALGKAGVDLMIAILKEEIRIGLALLGASDLSQVTPQTYPLATR
jgi:(S)-mandelate dehydrogenase